MPKNKLLAQILLNITTYESKEGYSNSQLEEALYNFLVFRSKGQLWHTTTITVVTLAVDKVMREYNLLQKKHKKQKLSLHYLLHMEEQRYNFSVGLQYKLCINNSSITNYWAL